MPTLQGQFGRIEGISTLALLGHSGLFIDVFDTEGTFDRDRFNVVSVIARQLEEADFQQDA